MWSGAWNKASFRNLLPNRFLPNSVGIPLELWSGGHGFKPHWGQFLMKFILFCLTLDLSDYNASDFLIVKNAIILPWRRDVYLAFAESWRLHTSKLFFFLDFDLQQIVRLNVAHIGRHPFFCDTHDWTKSCFSVIARCARSGIFVFQFKYYFLLYFLTYQFFWYLLLIRSFSSISHKIDQWP